MSEITTVTSHGTYQWDYKHDFYQDEVLASSTNSKGPRRTWTNSVTKGPNASNWREALRSGQCATSPLVGEETIVTVTPSVFQRKWKFRNPTVVPQTGESHAYGIYHDEGSPSAALPSDVTPVKNQALSRFYANLSAVDTRFKGLVFSGELRESLAMIRHPARALRNGMSDYLNQIKRFGRVKKQSRQSAVRATWLEYSFGWSPLINDIDNGITAFYTSDAVRPLFEMVRGFGMIEKVVNQYSFMYGPITNGVLRGNVADLQRIIVKLYGTYHSSGNGAEESLHRYGFRPSEFVPTLWELIPYSFVVDYFSNIGKILESWSYRTLRGPFMSETVIKEVERSIISMQMSYTPVGDSDDISTRVSPGSYSSKKRSVLRTPNAGFPTPSLELKVPGNWHQWANLAALGSLLGETRTILNR